MLRLKELYVDSIKNSNKRVVQCWDDKKRPNVGVYKVLFPKNRFKCVAKGNKLRLTLKNLCLTFEGNRNIRVSM